MIFNDPEPKPEETSAEEQTDFADAFTARMAGEEVGGEDQSSKDDKPADAAPASEAAAPAAAQDGSFDPFAGMTPEQIAHWQRVQHSEQSQRGRVAALTKKFQAAPAQTAPATATNEGGTDTGNSDTAADLEAKLKTAAEEYPDAVGPLVDVIADIRKSIAGLSQQVAPITEAQDTAAMTEAYANLEKAHPDYRDIAADANWDAWVADQPANIKALANSFDPREVSLTLTLFKAERQAAISTGEGENLNPNTATEEKRKRQLDGGRDVTSKNIPSAAGVPDDFGAAFNARAKAGA